MSVPAERPIFAPPPGLSSTAWTMVPPGLAGELPGERPLGAAAGDLLERGDARPAAARRRRLVLADRHIGYGPFASKISMASPAASVTMACLWSGRLPLANRVRLVL